MGSIWGPGFPEGTRLPEIQNPLTGFETVDPETPRVYGTLP